MAREFLQRQDMRIIDVAQSTGFRDQANFTRMFRRISGITPGQFRKLIRSESAGLVYS
jgi:AraC family transcriptional regulator